MKFQTIQRVLCCFMALLVMFVAVVKPIEAQATGIAATAAIVGISAESAIPLLLSALSVAYLCSAGSEIYSKIKAAVQNWIFSVSGKEYINGYIYDNKICFSSDVIATVASVSDSYLQEKYYANNYANMISLDWQDSSNVSYSLVCFSDNTPKARYSESTGQVSVSCYLPAIIFEKVGSKWTLYDESNGASGTGMIITHPCAATPTVSDQKGNAITRFNTIASSGIAIDIPSGAPTDTEKDKAYPIIDSSNLADDDVLNTGETVEVEVSTGTGNATDLSGILGWLAKIYNAIISLAASITEPIRTAISGNTTSIKETLIERGSIIQERLEAIPSTITDAISDVRTAVMSIPTAISSAIEDIIEWLKSLGASIADILEWLLTLPGILVDAITEALTAVFVPAEGYMDTKVEALRANFPLFDSVIGSAKQLRSLFNFATTPPIIYIDLGASTSWAMGGRTVFIDMSWYAEYKPTMDLVISVFLWLLFLWRIFLALPGIISGTSGFWGSGAVESPLTSGCTDISIIR